MIEAIDLIEKLADDNTLLVPGHGTLVHKKIPLTGRAMLIDILAMRNTWMFMKSKMSLSRKPYGAVRQSDAGRHSIEQRPIHWRSVLRGSRTTACGRRQAKHAGGGKVMFY